MRLKGVAVDSPKHNPGDRKVRSRATRHTMRGADAEVASRRCICRSVKPTSALVVGVILAASLSVACDHLFQTDYSGIWLGAENCLGRLPCPYDSQPSAELDVVQGGRDLTGFLWLRGFVDSVAVTGVALGGWANGLHLAGQTDCAELSGKFVYPEGFSLEGSITIEWRGCERVDTDVLDMTLRHEEHRVEYSGDWYGNARSCGEEPCLEETADDSTIIAEVNLVHVGSRMTGVFRLDGVLDSVAVTGMNRGWSGFQLAGRPECAEVSGVFAHQHAVNLTDRLFGYVTIDWGGCASEGADVWEITLTH